MASEVKTNKISPATASALSIGDSGDTITIPSGATLDISASTLTPPATMPASSGVNLTALNASNLGSGTVPTIRLGTGTASASTFLTGAQTYDTPAGGLTTASQWRLTADFTGNAAPIASNLEEVDAPVGFGVLGSSMTESSGIFTFPSTGYWRIDYQQANDPSVVSGGSLSIFTTTNDSTYVAASVGYWNGYYDQNGAQTSYIMDVTDTTTHKVRFHVNWNYAPTSQTTRGDTNFNETYMTFVKLGDT